MSNIRIRSKQCLVTYAMVAIAALQSVKLSAQSTFYVQKGNLITKIENGNPDKIKAIEWQVRLYKTGHPPSGNNYWSLIRGNSAAKVMNTLKSSQEFELNYNEFMGKGRTEDPVYTNFNPLGPIAIIDASKSSTPAEHNWDKIAEQYEKANEYRALYDEADGTLKNIFEPGYETNSNPFNNYGDVFKEYSEQLKEVFSQINSLRTILNTATDQNIANAIRDIDKTLDRLESKAKTLRKPKNTDAIEETLRKELANQANSSIKEPIQGEPEIFQMFFTANFSVPAEALPSGVRAQKRIIFFSGPISYEGDFDELKDRLAQEFERAIKKHPEYPGTQYALSYYIDKGAARIKSLADCDFVMKKLKQSISDGWNGDSRRFKIIQL